MFDYYLKEVPNKGRGVFANRDFEAGEIVESSPVVVFTYEKSTTRSQSPQIINGQQVLVKTEIHKEEIPNEIHNIVFNWSYLTQNGKKESCIALGYGSLFNSANPSNMRYEADENNKVIKFIAVQEIKKDEELTINYSGIGGSNISEANSWFKTRDIEFKE